MAQGSSPVFGELPQYYSLRLHNKYLTTKELGDIRFFRIIFFQTLLYAFCVKVIAFNIFLQCSKDIFFKIRFVEFFLSPFVTFIGGFCLEVFYWGKSYHVTSLNSYPIPSSPNCFTKCNEAKINQGEQTANLSPYCHFLTSSVTNQLDLKGLKGAYILPYPKIVVGRWTVIEALNLSVSWRNLVWWILWTLSE